MSRQPAVEHDAFRSRDDQPGRSAPEDDARERLVAGLPVIERRLDVADISTAVLEGGHGPPVLLLHGPGESALWWMRVIPDLVSTHRVVVPDLPAHGASAAGDGPLDAERLLSWLDELIERTCPSPPALVGRLVGGALAARFAVGREDRIRRLMLVDAMGLSWFRPSLGFFLNLVRFLARPTRRTYDRFLPHCMYDPDGLREGMGNRSSPTTSSAPERRKRRPVSGPSWVAAARDRRGPGRPDARATGSVPARAARRSRVDVRRRPSTAWSSCW